MGGRRVDKEWPKPRRTRHVWIRSAGRFRAPRQGLVLEWRRHAYKWHALTLFVEDEDGPPRFVQQWFPAADLSPVKSDPNDRWRLTW